MFVPAGYPHVDFLHFFAVTALYCLYRHAVTGALSVVQALQALGLVGGPG